MTYAAPVREMHFALRQAGLDQLAELPGFEAATPDMVSAILDEASRFASNVLDPLNQPSDLQGSQLVDGAVQAPDGFSEAYRQYVEAGWMGLAQPPDFGGQGLPFALHMAICEMWNSACLSFALSPMLTSGATNALKAHASDEIAGQYVAKMVSAEWTGTMNLTEPQAGSDLSVVKTRAVPQGDHYLISGQKIFISWGDHDLTDNIVHLVLARLPDAPAGSAGISLFVVPKYLLNADGSPGARNDVRVVSIEHKLGIHGSPTCVMSFGDDGGAVGYLVGESNRGLACMFTMMNHARLEVGLSGVALGERAYQRALEFARERQQGKAAGVEGRAPIIEHGDVRRMLLHMRALNEASRAIAYQASAAVDYAHHHPDEDTRKHYQQRVELLTPIVKGWTTEIVNEVTSLGIQIHGGMGYIEETGAAQYARDARITAIYEGTNGIQAADLVDRKVLRDGGRAITVLLAEMQATADAAGSSASTAQLAERLHQGINTARGATEFVLEQVAARPELSGVIAFNFLMLMGTTVGAWKLVEATMLADGDGDNDRFTAKLAVADFYLAQILPRATAYADSVVNGGDAVLALPNELF